MRMKSLAVLGTVVVMGFGFGACRSSNGSSGGGSSTGGSGTGGSANGGSSGSTSNGGTGNGGTGNGGTGNGGTAGNGTGGGNTGGGAGTTSDGGACTPGTKASINDIVTGKIGVGTYAELTDVVATSRKFLTYKNKKKGTCLWAVFATDGGQQTEGPDTSLMIIAYGNDALTTDGGVGDCPTGTDAIPNDVKPGDKLDVMAGKVDQYAPSTCTTDAGTTVGAFQLNVLQKCPIKKNGTATLPKPYKLSYTEANTIAAGTDATTLAKWGGALVELDNVTPSGAAGSIVGKYGGIAFNETNLTADDTIFYKATDPAGNAWQYAGAPTFTKIVGLVYLNYCTYTLAPNDKCMDVNPPSDDCSSTDAGL